MLFYCQLSTSSCDIFFKAIDFSPILINNEHSVIGQYNAISGMKKNQFLLSFRQQFYFYKQSLPCNLHPYIILSKYINTPNYFLWHEKVAQKFLAEFLGFFCYICSSLARDPALPGQFIKIALLPNVVRVHISQNKLMCYCLSKKYSGI